MRDFTTPSKLQTPERFASFGKDQRKKKGNQQNAVAMATMEHTSPAMAMPLRVVDFIPRLEKIIPRIGIIQKIGNTSAIIPITMPARAWPA
jgi:hypothetical protein